MFCPKCAAQNIDGAHFCRACGANISLIPQALSGQMPTAPEDDSGRRGRRRNRERAASFDDGIRNVVMGFGFMAVAVALAIFGGAIGAHVWWFWMLLPAFAMLGKGIAEIVRVNQAKQLSPHRSRRNKCLTPRRVRSRRRPIPVSYARRSPALLKARRGIWELKQPHDTSIPWTVKSDRNCAFEKLAN